jgi:hypothetical protein
LEDLSGESKMLVILAVRQAEAVMPALVAGIHAETRAQKAKSMRHGAAWMAGTSPAMTINICI